MPYNPVKKYPLVIANIEKQMLGCPTFHMINLKKAIMEELGTIRQPTIQINIEAMLMLGYIFTTKNPLVFSLIKQEVDGSDADKLIDGMSK